MPFHARSRNDDIDRCRHELNTPLTVIHARAQRMERHLRGTSTASDEERVWLQTELGHILSASRELRSTIAQLPDILRC